MYSFAGFLSPRLKLIYKQAMTFSLSSTKNTYILERVNEAPLAKLTATRTRRLKPRHFIYKLIEDTNLTEAPDLKVILTTFVEGIGDIGDIISVKADYARHHLLLPRRAVYATPENIDYYHQIQKGKPKMADFSSIYAGMTLRFLSKKVIPVFMSSEESWTIEPWHIRVAFRIEGVVVPEDCIKLPEAPVTGPDPTKENKDFVITVTINKTESVPVRCRIFHIMPEVGIPKLSEEFYLNQHEAIFKEQEDFISNLPPPELEDNRPESNVSLKEKYRIKLLQ